MNIATCSLPATTPWIFSLQEAPTPQHSNLDINVLAPLTSTFRLSTHVRFPRYPLRQGAFFQCLFIPLNVKRDLSCANIRSDPDPISAQMTDLGQVTGVL